ncbi:MAG: redox-sensing transcriptional repressor Rex [Oscillospiraceae bacterium]|nr:redox-sensing transcriptional repressor Rex [Oscillospiraceae bacterium]
MSEKKPISLNMYNRLSTYLNFLKNLPPHAPCNISATTLAQELLLNDVVVRKDLACVSDGGKPKIGYIVADLVKDIEHFLGRDNLSDAVLVGAGNLGKALISYGNFENYGLKIIAAFDSDPSLVGREIAKTKILDVAKAANLCNRMNIKIGIITVPGVFAQEVCDMLVEGGVRAIWNFAPVTLKVPGRVIVQNEDMAASLAILLKQLDDSIAAYGLD